jgi:hypothetical protein
VRSVSARYLYEAGSLTGIACSDNNPSAFVNAHVKSADVGLWAKVTRIALAQISGNYAPDKA